MSGRLLSDAHASCELYSFGVLFGLQVAQFPQGSWVTQRSSLFGNYTNLDSLLPSSHRVLG